jgi:hypothetical protein
MAPVIDSTILQRRFVSIKAASSLLHGLTFTQYVVFVTAAVSPEMNYNIFYFLIRPSISCQLFASDLL